MSSDELKNISEGITKGILSWSLEQIKSFAVKFKEKELAFIQDKKTIEIVKEQYLSGELAVYRRYVEDNNMLFLLKMGLTLRRLEDDVDRKKNLKDKIFGKYGAKGLHITQFVENGILNRYIGILIENITSIEKFKQDIKSILENIDKYVLFVKKDDNDRYILNHSNVTTTAHPSRIFIVSGISNAAKLVRSCEDKLKNLLTDYELEKISSGEKEILFFKRKIEK
ncbi:MAG: hypothetical protein AABY03_02595 [Nanoarchaeota archaeon]